MMRASTREVRDVHAAMVPRGPMGMRGIIEKPRHARGAIVRLLSYLKPFRGVLALVFLLIVAFTLCGLLGPYLMGVAIDRYIATKDVSGLAGVAALMLGVYVVSNILQAATGWIMARVSQNALKQVRNDLFSHLQSLPLSFFDRNPAGALMSRLTNDVDAVNQAVSQNITSLFGSVLSLFGILVAMFLLDRWLALATLVVVPIMFAFTRFVARYTRKGFRRLQGALSELNSTMEESISGHKVVKAFRRSDAAMESFKRANDDVFRAGVYANTYALLLMPLTGVLGNFFVIVLAGLGGWLALRDLVSVGVIATFIMYGQNFINPLRQLANMYNSIQAALAGAERVFEILDTPAEVDAGADAPPFEEVRGDVRFEHVRFGYQPGVPVIKDMTLAAKRGTTIALVGPTGAGKTTVINLLTRFYEIDEGSISIDDIDIRRVRKADLRRKLGLVLQDTFLFSDTILENIRYGRPDVKDEECMYAARTAEAEHFILQFPQGYHTDLTERAGNLSQGQRQLLAIARAILADPSILILDEATSSVDTRTEARIQKALLRLMAGRTSFVIAHRLSTIRDADQVLVVKDGEIVERGTHYELLERRGFYRHLYESQFKGETI